jgi:F-box and leucine-rich repeat protein 2/20
MESINFQACTSLSDDAFQVPSRSDFFGGGLKKLTLTSCMLLTGASIAAIARNCPALEKINLGQTDVSDDDVRALVEHCPSLVRLDLEGTGISVQSLKHLTLSPCRKTMRTINLWGCTAIDDEALLLLAGSCTASLRKLHLVECQVSDEGVRNICAACTDVRVLSLGSEDGICTSLSSSISHLQRYVTSSLFGLTNSLM